MSSEIVLFVCDMKVRRVDVACTLVIPGAPAVMSIVLSAPAATSATTATQSLTRMSTAMVSEMQEQHRAD
jgi:hypothetical protein